MIIKDSQKVVDYFGVKLAVPTDCSAIATDRSGDVWSYCGLPYRINGEWMLEDGHMMHLCMVELDGMDWRDTLMEV